MAGKGSSVMYDIEKFNGKNNFTLWRQRMMDILIRQGLSKVLQGKGKKPETSDEDWVEMEERAVSAIRLNLSDEVLQYVVDLKSALQVWAKLESIYMTKSLTNKLFLKKQLYSLQMEEGSDLLEHINTFNQILSKLASLEVSMEDEDRALLLLSSLPASYDHLVTTLLYGKETLETDEVTAALLSNDTRKRVNSVTAHGEGLIGKVKEQERGRTFQRGSGSKGRSKSRGGKTKLFC